MDDKTINMFIHLIVMSYETGRDGDISKGRDYTDTKCLANKIKIIQV